MNKPNNQISIFFIISLLFITGCGNTLKIENTGKNNEPIKKIDYPKLQGCIRSLAFLYERGNQSELNKGIETCKSGGVTDSEDKFLVYIYTLGDIESVKTDLLEKIQLTPVGSTYKNMITAYVSVKDLKFLNDHPHIKRVDEASRGLPE